MRISINTTEGLIVIDGTTGQIDCTELLAQNISAVQWNGDSGELEFVGHSHPNQTITDFSSYQSYIDNATPFPPEPEAPPETELPAPVTFEPPRVLTPDQQVMFDHENRILALEGKPSMPQKEFFGMLEKKTERYMAVMNAAMQAALNEAKVS